MLVSALRNLYQKIQQASRNKSTSASEETKNTELNIEEDEQTINNK